ncbi:hypothetical protein T492DRAFT_836393 [Pavlovales sp. CCMP2436]|nr:hypothetical protein T492DRAFT_836393 [Pavlovales sp. CCMP2436]
MAAGEGVEGEGEGAGRGEGGWEWCAPLTVAALSAAELVGCRPKRARTRERANQERANEGVREKAGEGAAEADSRTRTDASREGAGESEAKGESKEGGKEGGTGEQEVSPPLHLHWQCCVRASHVVATVAPTAGHAVVSAAEGFGGGFGSGLSEWLSGQSLDGAAAVVRGTRGAGGSGRATLLRPCRLLLLPPLVVRNLLPCALAIRLLAPALSSAPRLSPRLPRLSTLGGGVGRGKGTSR